MPLKPIKVSLKVKDYIDYGEDIDEYVASFGILAKGLWVTHTSLIVEMDGWFETTFQVEEDRLIAVLDCINALTLFEAEAING